MSRHALVLGASGISGWACTNQLLHDYPRPGIWKRITGLTRRPMDEEERSYWPKHDRLKLVSGFDVHNDSEEVLEQKFKEKIPDVNTVTHVYYLVHDPPPTPGDKDPHAIGVGALRKTVTVLNNLAPNLEFIHVQYGSFIYGTCFPVDFHYPRPLSESLPSLPSPYGGFFSFSKLTDFMENFSSDKPWSWCFVPRINMYNAVYPIATYLSLYAYVNGKGAECPFPGSFGAWKALTNDGGADMIAKAAIYLSLLADPAIKGQGFNVASSDTPWNWEAKWPAICSWFGLVGMPPIDKYKDQTRTPGPEKYISAHKDQYNLMVAEYELKGWPVVSPTMDPSVENWALTKLNADANINLQKLRSVGFTEEEDPKISWYTALDRMRKAKVIP
ncbi:predicted protein [Uncinocarpus reesii 1704]|uniref:PRISE-like Rossmann-fold domain-containing protein n=1 Tax=Uncinocarpus reesii (strain UAMH 1704) TaxID=336963 RepID=C4JXK7_UNCRE|nr:uncharacterized protein UREG_06380 [Uncinocarpus reesii 1704]EEP81515.1 predicted protein [Uncinocarpus reesii 1704]